MRSTDQINTTVIEQEYIPDGQPKVYVIANSVEEAMRSQEKIERKGGMRLTNVMRESILLKVDEYKFQKPRLALNKQEAKLAHRAMVAAFGKTALDQLAKIGPPYAYVGPTDGYGNPNLDPDAIAKWRGTGVTWRVGAMGHQYNLCVRDPLPLSVSRYDHKLFTVKDGALAEEIATWYEVGTALAKEAREMQLKVRAVLDSVTTFTSLEKTWPAGKRFYQHLPVDFPFRNQVPALRVEELNSALDL